MEQTTHSADPLSPRLRWFAPWRWKRRWAMCAALALVVYVLSPVPAWYVMAYKLELPPTIVRPLLDTVYAPIDWLCDHSEVVTEFYTWQFRKLVGPV